MKDEMLGRLIGGRFQLVKQLGEGGMGAVFEAIDIKLNKKVAVKVLQDWHSGSSNMTKRFIREAETVGALSENAHICEVIDHGYDPENGLFLVMSLLRGKSLKQILPSIRENEDYVRLTDILLQVLDALSFAHRKEVIHRDIKPENIFVVEMGDRKDFVKVLDFGIAKIMGDESVEELTKTGMLLGTPSYMSPEQCRDTKDIDTRSDIYSIGVVMYEALTGQKPFQADPENCFAIFNRILISPVPPPRNLNRKIPAELERITLKAMTRFPSDRYQTADEMAGNLRRFRETLRRQAIAQSDKVEKYTDTNSSHRPQVEPDIRGRMPIAAKILTHGLSTPRKKDKWLWMFGVVGLLIIFGGVMVGLSDWREASAKAGAPAEVRWIFSEPAMLEFTETEITLGQYKLCERAGACKEEYRWTKSENKYCNEGHSDRDNHPMNCVNWYGANEFCKWLDNKGRLPTENEWYSEASNGQRWKWPWSESPDLSCDYAIWSDENKADSCGKNGTRPVCSTRPKGNSVSGLCDMSGNVWEWTSSDFDLNFKVVRGGSWRSADRDLLRTSGRSGGVPSSRDNNIGFRCVRSSH
jgi:serine/threonine protein kinase